KTWTPHVNDIYHDFTLSHNFLYTADSQGNSLFVETGVYHGYGTQVITSGAYFYVAWRDSDLIYHERDDFSVAYGTTNSYEVVFNSYNPVSHNYYYDLLYNGTRKEQVVNNALG